jgi:putative ABC transport system permease protein
VIRVALRGLLGRKLRASLTAIAVVLGVAMVSGTFVLTDSIDRAFDNIFTDVREGSSAVVSGKSAFDLSEGSGTAEPSLDESLLDSVRGLPDVAEAEGGVDGEAQLIGEDGKAIVYGGAPNLGFSIANGESRFNPLELVEGEWPGEDQVVIDAATADKEDFEVGQTVGVQGRGPVRDLEISGIVRFGSVSTIGGATLAGFDLLTAQEIFAKEDKLDEIAVAAAPGVSDNQLVAEIREILPPNAEVQTAEEQARSDAEETNAFISFLQGFLLAFGGIALFVGAFVIANSLSITIAQRTREFATLRTIGASRRQVLTSIIVEALAVGVVASVIGLFLGLGLARLLFWVFDLAGFTLPNTGLLLQPRTVVVALIVGVGVTLIASLRPAIRATRVPPIAAVREGATLPESRLARFRLPGAILLAVAGFASLIAGLFVSGLGTTEILVLMGLGALLIFFGVALFASKLVPFLAVVVAPVGTFFMVVLTALFWPFWLLPFWLLRRGAWGPGSGAARVAAFLGGAVLNSFLLLVVAVMWGPGSGAARVAVFLGVAVLISFLLLVVAVMWARRRLTSWEPEWPAEFPGVLPGRVSTGLGRDNSRRNPQRTASTAAALMIGLALVTLVAVLGQGIRSTFTDAVDELFVADYAITAQNNFSPIPITAAQAVEDAAGVETVANVRTGEALVYGDPAFVTAVTPNFGEVIAIEWTEGSQEIFAELGADGAFVDDGFADDHDLIVGSPITITTPEGQQLDLVVRGIFDPPAGGSPFGNVTFSAETFDASYTQPQNLFTFVNMEGGVTDANSEALDAALADFPNAKAQTREEFKDNQIRPLSNILNILYVLLALSVVVSLFGIVNTLVLTVFERTRELGMLRAVGMTRRQVRRMIRYESVITALIGATLGIVLGIVLGGLLVWRVDFIEFALPTLQLVVFAIAAIVVGIIAAILPARRAARLNVLQALQYE